MSLSREFTYVTQKIRRISGQILNCYATKILAFVHFTQSMPLIFAHSKSIPQERDNTWCSQK